jgi:tetraacyldisaccharide 4'-kinase
VINVGNLSVGGSGKTPHVEYLISFLKAYVQVATLSRGYKRKTKGFLFVSTNANAQQVGDEPLMFKRKHPDITVTVSESRTIGIPMILQYRPETQAVIMDDAFQHLSVKPGLNILVTEYSKPFFRDFLLPMGRLREWRSASDRADIIIVSKCPGQLSTEEKESFVKKLAPENYQKVYFSKYEYANPYYLYNPGQRVQLEESISIVLLCAIANTDYLLEYLEPRVDQYKLLQFEDHHDFSERDIAQVKKYYDTFESSKKIIVTTEKDAMRLDIHRKYIIENRLPIFVLPVRVKILGEEDEFQHLIKQYLLNFKV